MEKNYSNNHYYEFEMIEEDLSFFQKRSILNSKKMQKNENTLLFFKSNKILSVEVNTGENAWLLYEKAKLFFSLFHINFKKEKYVLINENNEFFYGYIDGFPCVFNKNEFEAEDLLESYNECDDISRYGIGNVSDDYEKQLSLEEISTILNLKNEKNEKFFVKEESEKYEDFNEKESVFTNLFFNYKKNFDENNYKSYIRSYYFLLLGFSFLIVGFLLN